jgi:hypothetical protein
MADAGIDWTDVGCAYGGSAAAGSADIMVNELGLTGLPFINVANGCADRRLCARVGPQRHRGG